MNTITGIRIRSNFQVTNKVDILGVQYILDSVVTSLQENPNRKFVFVEMHISKVWFYIFSCHIYM